VISARASGRPQLRDSDHDPRASSARTAAPSEQGCGAYLRQLCEEWLEARLRGVTRLGILEDRAKIEGRIARFAGLPVTELTAVELSEGYAECSVRFPVGRSAITMPHSRGAQLGRKRYSGRLGPNVGTSTLSFPSLTETEQHIPSISRSKTARTLRANGMRSFRVAFSRGSFPHAGIWTGARRGELCALSV